MKPGLQGKRGINIEVTNLKVVHGSQDSLGDQDKQQVKVGQTAQLQKPDDSLQVASGAPQELSGG